MPLTVEEIRARLKEPLNKATISQANEQEARLCFHSEIALTRYTSTYAANMFFEWVRSLIPADKFNIFLGLFKFPVKTNDLTEQIFAALERVFDGQNPVHQYEFIADEIAQDWQDYRKEFLRDGGAWQEKGFEAMKYGINSVLVVDLPEQQTRSRPDPYWYLLSSGKVLDFKRGDGDVFEWIFFKLDGDRMAAFDDEFYRVFAVENQDYMNPGELLTEVPHDLGYCPARWFWTDAISSRQPDIKKSPLSNQLGELDWMLFYAVSKQHLDLYASYPIYSGFEQDCDYESQEYGHYCSGGFLKDTGGQYLIDRNRGGVLECPVCSRKRLAGVGSFIEIPPPGPENNNADLRNPVQITTIDRASLDYNVEEVDRLKTNIYRSVVGFGGDLKNDQAVNEKQVAAAFESRTTVLRQLKRNFEKAQEWANSTICRLRYGPFFVSASIDYGSEFYLYEPSEVLEMYQQAKTAGADEATLDDLQNQYHQTKYRNNPAQLQRVKVLTHLDPFRHLSRQEVREMYQAGQVLYEDYFFKVNLSTLILRFERENTSVLRFGELLEFDEKIRRINEIIRGYIVEPETEGKTGIKEMIDVYGIGVRAGAITSQTSDEEFFRRLIGVPEMSSEAIEAWMDDKGVRRPVTLKSKTETDANIDKIENQ